jgi:putative transcriptional regulator
VTQEEYLTGRLLLAMPGMFDPRFDHSVSVMCMHDQNGAFGIGIGQVRKGVRFRELLEELDIDPGDVADREVHNGGPVEPGRGFVVHSLDWTSRETLTVEGLCGVSASTGILRAIVEGRGPKHWLIALGYAGWGSGQLEGEMRRHGWYAAQGHPEVLFETAAESRWIAAWRAEGIDPALLASETGSA